MSEKTMTAKEFEKEVLRRRDEIIREQLAGAVEEFARQKADDLLRELGIVRKPRRRIRRRGRAVASRRRIPHGSPKQTLIRGKKSPAVFREGTMVHQVASLAYESLAASGHFKSGRAERHDMHAYLVASLGMDGNCISARLSACLKHGVLAILPDGF